ncbi:glycosyltransferase family 2 protein [Mucilaginibacter lappiensis]|uniref:Glycosyltransferase involved in cell wall biosynthesis n=1 Tax=Mucilaginibacter lappiensis TaxID=354630 RepID=A0A841JIA9_9SPHI|nr:glycosyltransferase family 2 protein [Mucilaginibacter lappiensis]MBB6128175.1 glycosyltransferase involved in cell wall biosynthesis [Mucilaginibacter lappiensis]
MGNEKAIISFCIPTYNRSALLKKCIESIIGYQESDIEIVIQDNCSPDDTAQVAGSFKDSRIKYFRNEVNVGPIVNFSKVIESASGKYVYLLTDDDMLLAGAIDNLKKYISEHQPLAFKTALIMLLEKSLTSSVYSFSKTDFYRENMTVNAAAHIFLSSHIYTGLCFDKNLYQPEFIRKHDNNWYPSMALMGCAGMNCGYISFPTAIHLWENETFWGISPDKSDELNRGRIAIIKSLRDDKKIDDTLYYEICKLHAIRFSQNDQEELKKELPAQYISEIKRTLFKQNLSDKTRVVVNNIRKSIGI